MSNTYTTTTINQSPTLIFEAAEKIENAHGKAVILVAGKIKAATAGVNAFGLILSSENDIINIGDEVTVQIKDIGMWQTGEANISSGDELTSGADGRATKATSDDYVTAIALNSAEQVGTFIRVQIIKGGIK